MSKHALKSLTIACLRGCTGNFTLPFEAGKKLTVLYGESGTGKSTICDAFEFLGKGTIGSLEKRGLGRTESYWPSFGKNAAEIAVTLETSAGSCTGTVGNAEVLCDPLKLRPKIEVLRRARILDLVEAQAADKYKEIERFIDVGGPVTAEGALRDLIKSLKQSEKIALARVAENQSTIEQSWSIDGKPAPDAFSWADAQSRVDTTILETESKQIESIISAFGQLKDASGGGISAAAAVDQATENLGKAKQALQEAVRSTTADAGEVVAILESAKAYLHTHVDVAICPLCESSEKIDDLEKRVEVRLKAFISLRKAQAAVRPAETALSASEARLQAVLETIALRATDFEKTRSSYTWPSDVSLPQSPPPSAVADLPDWLATAEPLIAEWTTAKDRRVDRKSFVATVKSALATYRQNLEQQKALDILLPKLAEALKIAEEERHTFTDEILAAIAVNVGRLYEAVHPGEGLEKISLALDPRRRASLDIASSFEGKTGLPPQAYLSDSHLDTLGLCVFLALAAMDSAEETILILDDVLASVDEPHVDRVIEMLYDEATKFRHCVITSHYRPWKQKLRWGWLQNGNCQFVELSKWSAAKGLTIIQSVPDIETLRRLLTATPPDPQLISAKAGVILEAALDFLTLLYQCSIPRKPDGSYTLGDLLPSIDKKLKAALRVELLMGKDAAGVSAYSNHPLAPFLDELTRIAQVRNVMGCHFNKLSFDLHDTDAVNFGQQVLGLMEVLTDVNAGWPRNDKSGSYWATAGETRRLHPLKRPS